MACVARAPNTASFASSPTFIRSQSGSGLRVDHYEKFPWRKWTDGTRPRYHKEPQAKAVRSGAGQSSDSENARMRRYRAKVLSARFAAILIIFANGSAVTGCRKGGVATYPVAGSVKIDGRPADGAMVVFVPTATSTQAERKRPFGVADAEGRFRLTTFVQDDGAPAGQYKVLVQWPAPNQQADDQRSGRRGALGPDRLGGKYFNLENSTLTAKVEEQSNELPPFELKSR
jgi:hypothetical protein